MCVLFFFPPRFFCELFAILRDWFVASSKPRETRARGLVPNWLSKHQTVYVEHRIESKTGPYPLGAAAALVVQERCCYS